MFRVNEVNIVSIDEHLRAMEIKITNQVMLINYRHLYCHGVLHPKPRGTKVYIVEKDNRSKDLDI